MPNPLRLLVLCTVDAGRDAVIEVLRRGYRVEAVIGLDPPAADPEKVSGFVDVAELDNDWSIPYKYVGSYTLSRPEDRKAIESIDYDLVWVAGWQRLVPKWLIESCRFGAVGGHGSPDGIHGGRGRSPQNWALILGCKEFHLSLFRITPGIDDGPVVATRTFEYSDNDDIEVSYHRASLAMADMIAAVLDDPSMLERSIPQPDAAYYLPQRRPEDGMVDWTQSRESIDAQCRALSHPYPGLRSKIGDVTVTVWRSHPFDSVTDGETGVISACFGSGNFLVNCGDGRLLVREWTSDAVDWVPKQGARFESVGYTEQLRAIVQRHRKRHPDQPVSPRLLLEIE